MTTYQLKDTGTVALQDPKTGQLIYNCTRILGDQLRNNKVEDDEHEILLRAYNEDRLQPIDVRKSDSRFGTNGRDIAWDVMPSPNELSSFGKAFVQHACAIAVALETGKDVIIYCKNGRSRSPSVVAAFYLLFRGFSLAHIKKWFDVAYPAQRPLTAEKSNDFPNIYRFTNVLNLLIKCLAEPTKSVGSLNLDECIRGCSTALNFELKLILAGSNAKDLYPWAISNTSDLHQTAIPPRPNCESLVYHSPQRVLTRRQRRLQNGEGTAVACLFTSNNKRRRMGENETVADDAEIERLIDLTEDSSDDAEIERLIDLTEDSSEQVANNDERERADADDNIVVATKTCGAPNVGMKGETDPENACVTFCAGISILVCCTKQKMNESTFIVKDRRVVVLAGLDACQSFLPDNILDFSSKESESNEDKLCQVSSTLASHSNAHTLLVCENAQSFGRIASVIASFYFLFENLGAKTCVDRITRAFRDQCPSSFDDLYEIPGIVSSNALRSIPQTKDRTLQSILRNARKKYDERSEFELAEFQTLEFQTSLEYLCLPTSALIHEEDASTSKDCPDWLVKFWPMGDYKKWKIIKKRPYPNFDVHPVLLAIWLGSISVCSFLLSKLGARGFFYDVMSDDEASPLYLTAKRGDTLLVSWMLKNGGEISLEVENKDGKTPLFAASYYGGLDVTKILILYGAAMKGSRFLHGATYLKYLALDSVEKLRRWIKLLLIDDQVVLDLQLAQLLGVHRLILEYYYELSREDDDEDDEDAVAEINLDSMDHGDHDFLKHYLDEKRVEVRDLDELDEDEVKYTINIGARKKAMEASLKRVYPDLYELCYYGERDTDT